MILFQPDYTTSREQESYARYILRFHLWDRVRVQTIHEREPELRSKEKWQEMAAILAEGPNGSVEKDEANMSLSHWHVCAHTFAFSSEDDFIHFKLTVL